MPRGAAQMTDTFSVRGVGPEKSPWCFCGPRPLRGSSRELRVETWRVGVGCGYWNKEGPSGSPLSPLPAKLISAAEGTLSCLPLAQALSPRGGTVLCHFQPYGHIILSSPYGRHRYPKKPQQARGSVWGLWALKCSEHTVKLRGAPRGCPPRSR